MNIFRDFTQRVTSAVELILAARGTTDADLSRIVVEPPRDAAHGDLATNAAMVLAKPLGLKPRDLLAPGIREIRDKPGKRRDSSSRIVPRIVRGHDSQTLSAQSQ